MRMYSNHQYYPSHPKVNASSPISRRGNLMEGNSTSFIGYSLPQRSQHMMNIDENSHMKSVKKSLRGLSIFYIRNRSPFPLKKFKDESQSQKT